MEEDRIPKRVLYMNLETRRPRGRPRNRWQDEVRGDGRMVCREKWQEKVYFTYFKYLMSLDFLEAIFVITVVTV
jgi:hypothetical protein